MDLNKIDGIFEGLEKEVSRLKSVGDLVQEINVVSKSFSSTDKNLQAIRESLPSTLAEISKSVVVFNNMIHKQKEEQLSFLNLLNSGQSKWNSSQETLLSTWLERQSEFLQNIHTDLLVEIKRANEQANNLSNLLAQQNAKLDYLKEKMIDELEKRFSDASNQQENLENEMVKRHGDIIIRFNIIIPLLAVIVLLLTYLSFF